jgi:hypothetical protein
MRKLILILLMLASSRAIAQEDITVEYVHKKSLEYFEKQQWQQLIRLGERAIENGIESYLIRVRTGIAYYELEQYAEAIPHLRKAVDTGNSDGVTKEYLYYSYIFMGREEDANDVFFDMSDSRQQKIKSHTNDFISDLSGGIAYSFSNDESNNSGIDLDGAENVYGEQTLNGNQFYFDVGLSQLPTRWLKINYAFSYLDIDRQKQFMFNDERITDGYKQKQWQLYNELSFRAAEGLVICPSGHYINSKETSPKAIYDSVTYVYNSVTMSNDSAKYYYTLRDTSIEQDDFVLSLSAFKWFSVFKAGLSGSFSYLNGEHQTQFGASLLAFPFKKPFAYVSASAVVQSQRSVSNLIFSPAFGARLTEELWLECFASFGRMNNYNEMNGFMVYNNPDVITLKYGAQLKYYFPFNLTASLVYAGQQREKKYLTYSGNNYNVPTYSPQFITAEYQLNTIFAGLTFDF